MSLPFEITKFVSRKTAVTAATLYLISTIPATDQTTIIAKIAGLALVSVAFTVAQAWSNRGPRIGVLENVVGELKPQDNCADTVVVKNATLVAGQMVSGDSSELSPK